MQINILVMPQLTGFELLEIDFKYMTSLPTNTFKPTAIGIIWGNFEDTIYTTNVKLTVYLP